MLAFSKFGFNKSAALFLASIFFTGHASAQTQTVTGSLSVSELSAGQSTELTVAYTATDCRVATDAATDRYWGCGCISIVRCWRWAKLANLIGRW